MDVNLVVDITSSEAFLMLKKDSDSKLVDVRTEKEIFSSPATVLRPRRSELTPANPQAR